MVKKKSFYFTLFVILLHLFFLQLDMEICAAIYRVINPQGVTVRVSTEPVLYQEEAEAGCKIYLLKLGRKLTDFGLDKRLKGMVFGDLNGNGRWEKDEPGIAGIQVSNGLDIALTDNQGYFELDKEGIFIFLTVPNDYKMTTSWYRIISDTNMYFGLQHDREKEGEQFTFVHFTDPHTDLDESHNQMIRNSVGEMKQIDPDFVVVTGDMIYEGDKHSIDQARRWFNRYVSLIDRLDMPVYHTIGNHDVAGILCHEVDSSEEGYNKWLYYSYFGPNYFSFDWGDFHCLVLDPNQFDGESQFFGISAEQIVWLKKDLSFYHDDTPLLIFFHEPLNAWKNKDDFLNLLGNRKVRLFSGHWHFDVLLEHQKVLEQVTGALCGEWWKGEGSDGRLGGYRIFQVRENQINSFYRETGQERQIEFIEPKPITLKPFDIAALIYTVYAPVESAAYRIDQGPWISLIIDHQDNWFVVSERKDFPVHLEPGYHQVEIRIKDLVGEFSKTIHFKVDSDEILSFKELYSHYSTYHGHLIQVEGELKRIFAEIPYDSPTRKFLNGAIILKDHSGNGGILLGEYGLSKEEELEKGQLITARVIPLRFRWDSLERKHKLIMLLNLFRLPKRFFVKNGLKPEAVQILWLIHHTSEPGDGPLTQKNLAFFQN